jgi:hypothetical protein
MTIKDLAALPELIQPAEPRPHRDPAWIVDIDGTLALNNGTRGPFEYHRVSEDDSCPVIRELVTLLFNAGYSILICSGREAVGNCRSDTQAWLREHEIPYTNLFMRAEGDYRKDSVVKLEILDNYILPRSGLPPSASGGLLMTPGTKRDIKQIAVLGVVGSALILIIHGLGQIVIGLTKLLVQ